MNLDILEPFSREIVRHLLDARPAWAASLEAEGDTEATACLTLSGPRGTLLAYTDNHEMALSFGDWHEHIVMKPSSPMVSGG